MNNPIEELQDPNLQDLYMKLLKKKCHLPYHHLVMILQMLHLMLHLFWLLFHQLDDFEVLSVMEFSTMILTTCLLQWDYSMVHKLATTDV
jgi:hypothetical protein